MEKTRKIRCFTTFIILIILIIILLIMNVCIGTVHISFKAAFATLYDHSDRVGRIVWDIRMPRAIAAMILGGALALAGYLLQTFFHNPIAGPFVLGISSGAKMVVALVMVFLLGKCHTCELTGHDCSSVFGSNAFNGLCAYHFKKGKQHVNACGERCHDWLHMLCGD